MVPQMVAEASYPRHLECTARTRDGASYRIRPIRPDDLERERAFILGLSPASRYARMMCAMREPPAELLDRFVHVDYRDAMALVALSGAPEGTEGSPEQFIAVARYASLPAGRECEFAVAVSDAWQRRGVGTRLLRMLLDYAAALGFERTRGLLFAGNEGMRHLAQRLGMRLGPAPEGSGAVLEAVAELTPRRATR